jgi:hypothetical protein
MKKCNRIISAEELLIKERIKLNLDRQVLPPFLQIRLLF